MYWISGLVLWFKDPVMITWPVLRNSRFNNECDQSAMMNTCLCWMFEYQMWLIINVNKYLGGGWWKFRVWTLNRGTRCPLCLFFGALYQNFSQGDDEQFLFFFLCCIAVCHRRYVGTTLTALWTLEGAVLMHKSWWWLESLWIKWYSVFYLLIQWNS